MVRGIPAWSSEAASSPTPRPEPFTNVAIAQAVLFLNLSETARAHAYGRRESMPCLDEVFSTRVRPCCPAG